MKPLLMILLLLTGCRNSSTPSGFNHKGIGPIKTIFIDEGIDKALAKQGEELFQSKCATCHHTHNDFVGPKMAQITQKRSPEWIMNMILNTEEMLQKDSIAQDLLKKYNGLAMSNQHLTENQARAVLEFLRTL